MTGVMLEKLPSKGLFSLGPTYSENFAIDSLELDIFNRLKS